MFWEKYLCFVDRISKTNISTSCRWSSSELMWQYTIKFYVCCHINSDDDQQQLVEILVLDILPIKLEYVSQNTLYHWVTRLNKHFKYIIMLYLISIGMWFVLWWCALSIIQESLVNWRWSMRTYFISVYSSYWRRRKLLLLMTRQRTSSASVKSWRLLVKDLTHLKPR